MKVTQSLLPEVLLLEPQVFSDNRGHFYECHHIKKFLEIGILTSFVQDNISFSKKNVLRGLHYQLQKPQDKLVYVTRGIAWDVVVDIRKDSPNFGKWVSTILSHKNRLQLFVPKGFAHGFCALSNSVDFIYKCSDYYDPTSEYGIVWNDPTLNIKWPIDNPILSDKDTKNNLLSELVDKYLPIYQSEVFSPMKNGMS